MGYTKFYELPLEKREEITRRWNINTPLSDVVVSAEGVPFVSTTHGLTNAGYIRPESLICGGVHNAVIRKNL